MVTDSRGDRDRILILCKHFSYGHGGTPESILLASQHLATLGLSCDVFTSWGLIEDVGGLAELPPPSSFVSLASIRLGDYRGVWIVGTWLRGALPLAIRARARSLPLTYSPKGHLCSIEFRGLKGLLKILYYVAIEVWVLLLSTHILFTSQLERTHSTVFAIAFRRKSRVLPEICVTSNSISSVVSPLNMGKSHVFGFLAQISERKGLEELVFGFLLFCEKRPEADARLIIAGTCLPSFTRRFEELRRKIECHSLGSRISFAGQVDGAKKRDFYAQVDMIVVPSLFESFGLVPIEAIASGCPLLVSPMIGVSEFLANREAIRYLNRVHRNDIATQLEHIHLSWPAILHAARDLSVESTVLIDKNLVTRQLKAILANEEVETLL